MSRLEWDKIGARRSENGLSRGVLYKQGSYGVPWNGLVSVSENPEGGEEIEFYADNIQYGSIFTFEKFKATIEAYTYPEEFAECDGSKNLTKGIRILQQKRSRFDLCYRTEINEGNNLAAGYKLHLVYNALASPSAKNHKTLSITPDIEPFSWDISTVPFTLEGYGMSATLEVDSTKVDRVKLKALEDILYGTETTEPRMPRPEEVLELIQRFDVYKKFADILNSHGHWSWDSFNFPNEDIPTAIDKETERHIFYNPESGTEYIQPSVAYTLLTDEGGQRKYSVVVIDQNNPSELASDMAEQLNMTSIGTTHVGNFYYYQYHLYV